MSHERVEQIFGQLNERMDAEADKAAKFLADVFSFEGVKRAAGYRDDNAAPCLPPDFVDNDHDGMS